MKHFISYLGKIRVHNKLTKPQMYLFAFSILLFLGILITLPIILLQKQDLKTRAESNISNAGAATTPATIDASILPLGIYMAGEWLPGRDGSIWPPIDWAAVDQRLDALQAHHVNAVWLTHVNGADAGEFARRAAARGIRIIASLTDFNCHLDSCKNRTASEHQTVINNELTAYGSAPPPLAWGIGDEPDPDARYSQWISVWKTYYPNEPITSVFRHDQYPNICPVGGPCGLHFLAMDHYVFYSEKNKWTFYSTGNPYPRFSTEAKAWEWMHHAGGIVGRGATPWAMAQSFQEVWGPHTQDSNDNIIIQPGGASNWVMPSPAQITWQAWSSLAVGAKGIWYYLHNAPSEMIVNTEYANTLPSMVNTATNTGSPYGLVYTDGRTTPQFEALGNAFGKLSSVGEILRSSVPSSSPSVSIVSNSANDQTAVANVLSDPASSKCWVVVAGGFQENTTQDIRIQVGAPITGLVSLLTGNQLPLSGSAGALQGVVTLAPGDGDVFECQTTAQSPVPISIVVPTFVCVGGINCAPSVTPTPVITSSYVNPTINNISPSTAPTVSQQANNPTSTNQPQQPVKQGTVDKNGLIGILLQILQTILELLKSLLKL